MCYNRCRKQKNGSNRELPLPIAYAGVHTTYATDKVRTARLLYPSCDCFARGSFGIYDCGRIVALLILSTGAVQGLCTCTAFFVFNPIKQKGMKRNEYDEQQPPV